MNAESERKMMAADAATGAKVASREEAAEFESLVPVKFVCKPNERSAEDGTREWPEIQLIWFTKISLKGRKKQQADCEEIRSIRVSKSEDGALSDALKQVSLIYARPLRCACGASLFIFFSAREIEIFANFFQTSQTARG